MQADGFSVARKMIFRDEHALFGGDGNIDESDGLSGCGSAGTCDARNGDGVIHAQRADGARGHRFCGFGRNSAFLLERLRGNAEKLFLDAVIIRNNAAEKYGGRARDVGNGSRNKTSGTAFRRTEGYFLIKAKRNQAFRER